MIFLCLDGGVLLAFGIRLSCSRKLSRNTSELETADVLTVIVPVTACDVEAP